MPARVIRQKINKSKRSQKSLKTKTQRAGAIYTFDLNDKIGGQASYKSLYKTTDSDCPSGGVNDANLGNSYYDPSAQHTGGGSKHRLHRHRSHCSCSHKSNRKTSRNNSNRSNKKKNNKLKYNKSRLRKH